MKAKVLIVGLGISGMASAVALQKQGFAVKIIERAKERRTGGYFLGIHKKGIQAGEHLGVVDKIHFRTPLESQNWELLADGSRIRVAGFADQLTAPKTLLRGDVEAGLWQAVENQPDIEIVFGTTVTALKNLDNKQVSATLKTGDTEYEEQFDLVIGADGVRSTVRKLAFGPDEHFVKPLNKMICAFQLKNEVQTFKQKDGLVLSEPHRALWIFPLEDHTPTALFTYECKDIDAQFKQPAVQTLRSAFAGMHNEEVVNEVLDDLSQSKDYLFDSVMMIQMPKWVNGRIVLVGDSAWCMTLYSGMGATGGLMGSDELGKAIGAHKDLDKALAEWEKTMRPFIKKQQLLVKIKKNIFIPNSQFALNTRRVAQRLLGIHLRRKKAKAG